MPPIWVGFWAPNSLNKGPFFGRFSLNKGGLSRNWRKIAKNGWFSTKFHHKSGYVRKFRELEEGTFLKTGQQTPIHPQVMYPPGLVQYEGGGSNSYTGPGIPCACPSYGLVCNILPTFWVLFYDVSPRLRVCLQYFALVMGLLDEDCPKLCVNFGFQWQ